MTAVHLPALRVEQQDGLFLVSQRHGGHVQTVSLHPAHIRHLSEVVGLAPNTDPAAATRLATLARRLRVLQRRIDELGDWLTNYSDHEHADLSHELVLITALAELAEEFVADLPAVQTQGP